VRTDFLKKHPKTIERLLRGQIEANDFINANTEQARTIVNAAIGALTGKSLKPETIQAAWKHLTFTDDPVVSSLASSAAHAVDVGLLKPVELGGIYDLGPLNALLKQADKSEVPTS
jgi:NitT/TauT family transport system substrate-binding protein